MSRWIVTHVPAWLVLAGLVVLLAGGAVLAQRLIRRRFPALAEGAHNDASRFAFGVVGAVYAFFVGFVVSALWGEIHGEDEQVRAEGAAAVQLAWDRTVFDSADSNRIQQALLTYDRAILAEWSSAAEGRPYPEADKALRQLYNAYQQIQPRTDVQKHFLATSFANLDKVSQARTARVMQAQTATGPPALLWTVVLLTGGLILGYAIVYGVERARLHYAVVATIGTLVAAHIFLIMELSFPYVGAVATSPQPLYDVSTALSEPAT